MSRQFVAFCRALLLALACLGAFSLPASAATLNVPSTAYPTIQAAINAASNGDTVLIADGTYTGTGNVDLDFVGKSITVASVSGDPNRTIIDCQGSASANHRGFYLHNSEVSAVISGLTVENGNESGNSGGGMLLISAGVTIQNCVIKNNTAAATGGIYEINGGNVAVTLAHCTILGNTSMSSVGGGFRNLQLGSGGTITLTDCTITNNTANYGGGVSNHGSSGSTFAMTNCTISGNTASASGGGVDEINGGTVTLTSCTFTGNTAPNGGGGGVGNRGGAITLTNDILYGDAGGEVSGPGVAATFCDVQGGYPGTGDIDADPLFVNAATSDIHLQPGSPCLGTGTAAGAPATDMDGRTRPAPPSIGAYELGRVRSVPAQYATIQAAINDTVSGDTVLISDGTYTGPGNVDLDFGGRNITVTSQNGPARTIINCQGSETVYHRGFTFHSGETNAVVSGLTIENGYVYYNESQGGGIYNDGLLRLTNCTVSSNYADSNGGGVYNSGMMTVTNCTLTGNVGFNSGGGVYNGGTLTLTGSTIINDGANLGGGVYNTGTLTVTNCAVTDNIASDLSAGGGLYNAVGSTGALTNCTLTRNIGYDVNGVYNGGALTLTNDILYGDTSQPDGEIYGAGVTATFCDVQGGYAGTGNVDADPLFSSASDLHLQSGSPCLGAGTANGAPTTTLDGRTRPNPPSIGAYEATLLTATAVTVYNVTGSAGQTLTLNARLKNAGGVVLIGKTLSFSVDGAAVGTGVTGIGGTASLHYVVPAALAVGSHTLTAAFAGDSGNAASSGTGTLTVTKANTALTVSAASGTPGQTVTLRALLKHVAGGAGLGGETVGFFVDGTAVGTAVTTSAGLAGLSYVLPAGAIIGSSHPVTAAFAGDGGNNGSTGSAKLTVSKFTTTLTVAAGAGTPGQTVTLSATLKKGVSGLGGQAVAFSVDGTAVGTAVTSAAGVAALPYAVPAGAVIGSHPVAAAFAGDGSDSASTGKGTLAVKNATALAVAGVSGAHGTSVMLTATLTANGAGVSGKTLTFKVDGKAVGMAVSGASGTASLTYAVAGTAKAGSHPVGVSFAGDAGDVPASGAGTLTVN